MTILGVRRLAGVRSYRFMFVHAIEHLLKVIGLPLVFFGVGIESMGIPIPGETVLVIAAVAAGRGTLVPWQVALCAWAGAVIGDNIGYALGRHYGERFWMLPGIRRFYHPRHVERAESFFTRRRGWLVVFLARFVAILRIFAGPIAGISRMHWRSFLIANALGAACWVAAVMAVGLFVGSNLDRAIKIVENGGYIGLAVVALLAVAGGLLWLLGERRKRNSERETDESDPN
jgi:membrane protein DedA with SNARE-associated domain